MPTSPLTHLLAVHLARTIAHQHHGNITIAADTWGVHPRSLRRVLRAQSGHTRILDTLIRASGLTLSVTQSQPTS